MLCPYQEGQGLAVCPAGLLQFDALSIDLAGVGARPPPQLGNSFETHESPWKEAVQSAGVTNPTALAPLSPVQPQHKEPG